MLVSLFQSPWQWERRNRPDQHYCLRASLLGLPIQGHKVNHPTGFSSNLDRAVRFESASSRAHSPLILYNIKLCNWVSSQPCYEWGQLLQVPARLFPFLYPWGLDSFPSTYSELPLALSPWFYCPCIYVIRSLLPFGFLWRKMKDLKWKREKNEMKWNFKRFFHCFKNYCKLSYFQKNRALNYDTWAKYNTQRHICIHVNTHTNIYARIVRTFDA